MNENIYHSTRHQVYINKKIIVNTLKIIKLKT